MGFTASNGVTSSIPVRSTYIVPSISRSIVIFRLEVSKNTISSKIEERIIYVSTLSIERDFAIHK